MTEEELLKEMELPNSARKLSEMSTGYGNGGSTDNRGRKERKRRRTSVTHRDAAR